MCLFNAHFIFAVYRAQFPYTYREMISELHADYKTVIPAVLLLIAFSVWGADFLRKTGKTKQQLHFRILHSIFNVFPASLSPSLTSSMFSRLSLPLFPPLPLPHIFNVFPASLKPYLSASLSTVGHSLFSRARTPAHVQQPGVGGGHTRETAEGQIQPD